jgi:hypothetical protein
MRCCVHLMGCRYSGPFAAPCSTVGANDSEHNSPDGLLLRLWQSVETAMAEIVVRATMRNYFKTLPQVLNTSLEA